ncbi:hypothetical protein POPTR_003G185401v4 [Populus trichocarpa]|uniref:Uncharacterized protein n=2 Tax=Populus trichocarpa TaxID=3694 RepID=A0ACC0TA35_POPTR|nr:hypothetical protein POPTR_003G185401v4 [Populus trichocarpa]
MQCPKIQNLCLQMGLSALPKPQLTNMKSLSTGRVLKPSSLQLCVQMNEPEKVFKSRVWNSVQSENSSSVNIWDYSDAEDTPTSSWSTLPNRIQAKILPSLNFSNSSTEMLSWLGFGIYSFCVPG